MSPRARKVVVALGAPGMGKSSLALRIVEAYPGDVRALDPSHTFDELGEWPGRRNVMEWVDTLTGNGEGPAGGGWGPGLVVLDDADRYLLPHTVEGWRDLWLANRHLGLDVMVTAHRPQAIPKDLLGAASELWLFAMEEPRAVDYLRKIPTLAATLMDSEHPLPTVPGMALRIVPRASTVQLVKLF